MITIEDFKKIDIRIGRIMSAERIEGSDKLLRLIFDVGEENLRQVLAGIAGICPDPSILVGKEMPLILNLEPRKFMGEMSNGMILAADKEGQPVLLCPIEDVPTGSIVK